eukprot:COSAG01_NODE_32448_length_581_cov_0.852697_1_plen_42_part_10
MMHRTNQPTDRAPVQPLFSLHNALMSSHVHAVKEARENVTPI